MSPRSRRVFIIILLLLLALLSLFFARCSRSQTPAAAAAQTSPPPVPSERVMAAATVPENVTAARLTVPPEVLAGAAFRVDWTGPDNVDDYVTIVRPDAQPASYHNYRETRFGPSLQLLAPIEPGEWEVRYVTARSKTILGRARVMVTAAAATLSAPNEVNLGAPVSIAWTGPANKGDFVSIVRAGAPDTQVGNYSDASKGSPLSVIAPAESGEAEIRYVTGQGRKVLARRKLVVLKPDTSLEAAPSVVAGRKISVTWRGPANAGDYITIVPKGTPDGQHRNYTEVAKGSPLEITALMEAGPAELRYITGTEARVLTRRPIVIEAANVTLDAPEQIVAGAAVTVEWSGPNNPNDYITIVPASAPDGQHGNYTNTAKGSPLTVTAPMQAGPAEIRYMSGQGAKVLGRRSIAIVPAQISLHAPAEAAAGASLMIEWEGPNNPNDYLTLVPKTARDGAALHYILTSRGSPGKMTAPKEPGIYEIRYMSGQGHLVLGRSAIEIK